MTAPIDPAPPITRRLLRATLVIECATTDIYTIPIPLDYVDELIDGLEAKLTEDLKRNGAYHALIN